MEQLEWNILGGHAALDRRWRKPRNPAIDAIAGKPPTAADMVEDIDVPTDDDEDDDEVDTSTDDESTDIPDDDVSDADDKSDDTKESDAESDDDDAWLNELTPIETPEVEESTDKPKESTPLPVPESVEPLGADASKEELDAAAELQRIKDEAELEERLQGLTTVDPQIAKELLDVVVKPAMDAQRKRDKQEIEDLRKRLDEVKSTSENAVQLTTKQQRQAVLTKTNSKILERYPKAKEMMNSVQFRQFLDANTSPYATEKKSDILERAYASGDADFVIETLDAFKASIKKPSPVVSADSTGSTGTKSTSGGKQTITAEQYQKRRAKLRAMQQTPEVKRRLRLLSESYTKQFKGK